VAGFPDSIWARLPGHEASVTVRNPSSESGPAVPAVFAVRTATAGALFAQGGVSPDSLRVWGDRPLAARPLADVTLQLDVRERVLQHASAPNAIGILERSDVTLKQEYVLFSAHMDHIGTPSAGQGCTARGADSICNGADHYSFAKKGVPILFFTTGLHPDYHQVSDSPDKIDAEKEARFARLVFHLGLAVANTPQRPRWNPDSYKRIVGGGN